MSNGNFRNAAICLVLLAAGAVLGTAFGVREGKVYTVPTSASAGPEPILLGVSVGPITFSMTRDQVIKALGRPDMIYFGDTRYSLRDSPFMAYYVFPRAGLSILFQWDRIFSIAVLSEHYQYGKGIRVGMNGTTAESILGPFPVFDVLQSSGAKDKVYEVYHSVGADYRLAYYDVSSGLYLKVSTSTNRVTEIMLLSPSLEAWAADNFWVDEPMSPSSSSAVRRQLAKGAGTGVPPLEQYALVTYTQDSLRVEDNYPLGPTKTARRFVLQEITSDAILKREALFDTVFAGYGAAWPTATEVIAKVGLPLSFEADYRGQGNIAVSTMLFGKTNLIFGADGKLTNVYFSPNSTYKANGRIGVGSRREEVFAEFGAPLKVVSEYPLVYDDDRVLYNYGEGSQVAYMRYQKSGYTFWFDRKGVSMFSREWRQPQ